MSDKRRAYAAIGTIAQIDPRAKDGLVYAVDVCKRMIDAARAGDMDRVQEIVAEHKGTCTLAQALPDWDWPTPQTLA